MDMVKVVILVLGQGIILLVEAAAQGTLFLGQELLPEQEGLAVVEPAGKTL